MKKALVPLADGVEEMEAVIIIDVLRRAGWNVVPAGLRPGTITASRGVKLVPDTELNRLNIDDFDVIVLPGGAEGTKALLSDNRILDALRVFDKSGKMIAAVCAAPLVLQAAGIIRDRKVTCHRAVLAELVSKNKCSDRVVVDGNLVTSQGPGTSFEFALKLIELADGPDASSKIRQGLVLPPS